VRGGREMEIAFKMDDEDVGGMDGEGGGVEEKE